MNRITGNIANFSEQFKSILEKHVKLGQFITVVENLDEKQLTISISADIAIDIAIANSFDIYNVVKDGILYVYFFHVVKKGKKNIDSRDQEQIPGTSGKNGTPGTPGKNDTPEKDKEIVINYKDAVAYNITLAGKGVANISKNLKKHKLEMITRLDGSHTLYKFMNKYLFMIDSNGTLFYYPDSIAITSLKSWCKLYASKHNLASVIDSNITLDKYLLLNKFVSLECHLDTKAYELCDVIGCNSVSSNVAIGLSTTTCIQNQNNLNSDEEQLNKSLKIYQKQLETLITYDYILKHHKQH